MKNLRPSQLNCFDFHKNVIDRKKLPANDGEYKIRLTTLNTTIEKQFEIFEDNFGTNSIELVKSINFSGQDKKDLSSLYKYSSKLIQELKSEITTTATNRIISTCQNCTINAINSFDHMLPQNEFSEFTVNPKNLFPSCTQCNSYKGIVSQSNGERLFLNLYLDNLPVLQYLYVDVALSDDTFKAKFYLDNRLNIDRSLYNIILSHYDRLNLCKRFSENVDLVITPLVHEIKAYLSKLTITEIVGIILQKENLNKQFFGYNFWQSVLASHLVSNQYFLDYVQRRE